MSKRAFIGLSAFLLATFAALTPASAADAKRQVVTTPDGDYFGFDLRAEQNVTLDQCSTSCVGDKSCKAFTYNPKVKWCFLKSDFNQLNSFPGAVAGKIVEIDLHVRLLQAVVEVLTPRRLHGEVLRLLALQAERDVAEDAEHLR